MGRPITLRLVVRVVPPEAPGQGHIPPGGGKPRKKKASGGRHVELTRSVFLLNGGIQERPQAQKEYNTQTCAEKIILTQRNKP